MAKDIKKYKTLVVVNFSGGFNDKGIGHEVINFFDANDNKGDFYLFYVPPYGTVGCENDSFIDEPLYKGIKKIVIFDSTPLTNVLKLKAVALNPIPLENAEERNRLANEFKYGPKGIPLADIDFDGQERRSSKHNYISIITYKIEKDSYFNFEEDNIYIRHRRSKVTDTRDKINKAEELCEKLYKPKSYTKLEKTSIGEKNYAYKSIGEDFEKWYSENVPPLLKQKKHWDLPEAKQPNSHSYDYQEDNVFALAGMLEDEDAYTNFISSILGKNEELKTRFFANLVCHVFKDAPKDYEPCNLGRPETQKEALVEEKKAQNKKQRKKSKPSASQETESNDDATENTQTYVNGRIDLYLEDDKYRIVIENKINSGINGRHETVEGQIDQLETYKTYLNDLNKDHKKNNKVILLVPERFKDAFLHYDEDVPVITYKYLAEFFKNNEKLIDEKYRHHFLMALYKHAYTKEEDAVRRFIRVLAP